MITNTKLYKPAPVAGTRVSRYALRTAALALGVIFAAPGLHAQPVPSGCAPPPAVTALDPTPPINIGLLKRQLVYYRCTAYDGEVKNVLEHARNWVAQQTERPPGRRS